MKRMHLVSLTLATLVWAPGCGEGPGPSTEAAEGAEEVPVAASAAAPGEEAKLVVDGEGLMERARISDGEARVTALVKVSGGRIVRAALHESEGRLVYAYDLVVEAEPGRVTQVVVDALTAEIVSIGKASETG